MWNSDAARNSILEAEDKRILEELDIFAFKGHKMMAVVTQEELLGMVGFNGKKRKVEVCSLCGFRIRIKNGRYYRKNVPECPVTLVEKIMES